MKIWTIYKIHCAATGKSYVGLTGRTLQQRWAQHLRDARKDMDRLICKAIRKYGEIKFTLQILCQVESFEKAIEHERDFIRNCGTLAPHGYNLTTGGDGFVGYERSSEARALLKARNRSGDPAVRAKIAATLAGRKPPALALIRAAEVNRGRKFPPEFGAAISTRKKGVPINMPPDKKAEMNRKQSEALKGRVYTDEHRANISAGRKGMKFSAEHKANIAASSKGRQPSEETKQKLREAITGRKRSPESIERMRAAAKARVDKWKENGKRWGWNLQRNGVPIVNLEVST